MMDSVAWNERILSSSLLEKAAGDNVLSYALNKKYEKRKTE